MTPNRAAQAPPSRTNIFALMLAFLQIHPKTNVQKLGFNITPHFQNAGLAPLLMNLTIQTVLDFALFRDALPYPK